MTKVMHSLYPWSVILVVISPISGLHMKVQAVRHRLRVSALYVVLVRGKHT